MLTKRIIACLDVKDGVVVKGVRFRQHEVMGDVVPLARCYRDEGIDELVFYDITASAEGRVVSTAWVEAVAAELDIPFCVAGGIRTVADARAILRAGADKVSVNSPALERPELVNELAAEFGSQCAVVGVDTLCIEGAYRVFQYTGSEVRTRATGRAALEWFQEVEARGAGEIVINAMASDGTRAGYDLEHLADARGAVGIPLVASGGAGAMQHFADVFRLTNVDAALAAGVFHRGEIRVGRLKQFLREAGIAVRL